MNEDFKDISVPPIRSEATASRFRKKEFALRYGLALLYSVGGVVILKLVGTVFPNDEPPLILLALCVTAAAWRGGFGPGFLATLLVALGSWGFLIPPPGFAPPPIIQKIRLVLIVIAGTSVSALAEGLHRTLALLKRNEMRLRIVLDTAGLGIVECDRDNRITLANKHVLKLLSYPLNDLLGKPIRDLKHPDERLACDELFAKLQDGSLDVGDYETRYTRFDGSTVPVHVILAPIRDVEGRFLGSTATVEDITERKRYETEREQLLSRLAAEKAEWKRTFDTVPDLIAISNVEKKLVRVNKAMADRLGKTPEDCVGQACQACVHGFDRALAECPQCQDLPTDIPHEAECYDRKLGGHFLITSSPIFSDLDHRIGTVLVARDITKRKQAEEDLARSNRDLVQFANVVSHDLKEPLRMVEAFGGLLKERHAAKLDGEAREYLDFITSGVSRMSMLIKGMLEYSKVDRGVFVKADTDMAELVGDVLSNLRVAIDANRAVIHVGPMPHVYGNPTQLVQLFQNLIENAMKYRKPDVAPDISISSDRQDDQWLFRVKDNGFGVDPQYHDRIFELFQRLHTAEAYAGIGMGLAVCKKIVERHGGRIWIESSSGKGATFLFTLPCVREKEVR